MGSQSDCHCECSITGLTNGVMSRSLQLALILAVPIAIVAALFAVDRMYGLPSRGYDYVLRIILPPREAAIDLPTVHGPIDASRPLVVIDPGHGGHDPGAGQGAIREKDVTLAIANAIKDELQGFGGIRVALTREDDSYLLLAERSAIARRLRADLFLSIHADSAENETARGASVYVLSEKGSSQAAARIAKRENSSDAVNGVPLDNQNDDVNAILLDLSQTGAQTGSSQMARLLLRELEGSAPLHSETIQSAAFAVLKAPDVPSVLFETGYISNAGDAAYLSSAAGRKDISEAAAQAVRAFFARQSGS